MTPEAPSLPTADTEREAGLPEGWAGASLSECVDVLDSRRVPVNSDERAKRPGQVPYYGATGQVGWIDDYLFDEELLLLGEDGAPFLDKSQPISYIVDGKSWVNNHAHVLRAVDGLTSNWFLKFWLDEFDFSDYVTGSTRLKLTQAAMRSIPVSLPPASEQSRIVNKIESLIHHVKAADDLLSKVPAILQRFRQTVLAAACSGTLTKDWREQKCLFGDVIDGELEVIRQERQVALKKNPTEPAQANPDFRCEVPDTWRTVSLDELSVRVTSGSRDWKKYYRSDGTGTFIMAQNVRPLFFDRSFRLGVSPPLHDRDRERSRVAEGDVLVTIVGANTGDVCRVPEALQEHYVCQSVALIRPVRAELSPYLELYLNSPPHGQGQFKEWIYGEGRPHLSFDQLRQTAVILPSNAERREIVRRVHAFFELADLLESRVRAASQRAKRLTQSVLAKAFRGELVPTEAELARREQRDYEPASALLERIRAERANQAKSPAVSKRKLKKSTALVGA